jgi:hypothetical protein
MIANELLGLSSSAVIASKCSFVGQLAKLPANCQSRANWERLAG